MERSAIVLVAVVVAFSTLLTVHVRLVLGLARRAYAWRALIAFFVAPLAPYWGRREGMSALSMLWLVSAIGYLLALALSFA